ncbi:caspase family protein [Streptomyces sp. NPDC057743]|uniref:wHTH domain-containing protein n=1 Tax=Streptomyces sp. NPDC057743 TaxID=3346236 RepID=UPI00369E83DB
MTGSYRALLIGVPLYHDPQIDDLPFVTDDMRELEGVLTEVGYGVRTHNVDETDRESIDYAVETFFQDATSGETLLLYLSGHGIHHGGKDYLVPKGARTTSHDFRGKCLSLDFSSYVERSGAGDVVVFVDACREGIDLREMSVGNAVAWSEMRVARTGERHYCHVYACSPGERARFTSAGNNTFSIFSRALSTVVADEAGPSTLRELREQLQSATDALTAEKELPRQQIRVRTETEADDFVLFERPDRTALGAAGEHAWVTAARNHPAWKQIGDVPGAEAMHAATVALVAQIIPQFTRDEAQLAEDPWRPVGFAERMTHRVGWLLSKVLNPEKLALSPAEAALLVAAPYLYVSSAHRAAVQALEVQPTHLGHLPGPSPARANYEQFFNNRQRLVRRAELAGDDHAAGIAWWLFHRWLNSKPGGFQEKVLGSLLGPAESLLDGVPADADRKLVVELFELNTLSVLMRSLCTPFGTIANQPTRQLAGGAEAEQHVREQLLVVLLAVAHHLAIDPVLLPDVVVEHLGIKYSVDMAQFHQTLQDARWNQGGRTRVLKASCHHPAVGLALRHQAAALDALLGSVDVRAGGEAQLEPLQDLPAHATADEVRPVVTATGAPAYVSMDLRFRLADDRVQELLMGEQLYGDPALAIRELYQNALDACRYRGARTQYLRRRHPELAPWSGRITFKQGVAEDGRAYIECTDNGIGMGEGELREVFSHAGMRFADLPEYLDEKAEWREAGIELHPNSRFGIGVLSYFMIADDISVTTCRLDREGHAGKRLQVDIAGPGSLFYIHDVGRGYDAGTTVRLYLRPSSQLPSCTALLRRLLWISEYAVVAQDADARFEWEPDVLSPVAPLGHRDPHSSDAVREADVAVDATTRPDVWWTSTHGGVLADGVWIGVPMFGAVVNLTGTHAPQLTVDRRRALTYDTDHVLRRLRAEIPVLLRPGTEVFGHDWLSELSDYQPALADEIAAAAVTCRYHPWVVARQELDITAVGCFSMDTQIMSDGGWWERPSMGIPERVVAWRVRAWGAAGAIPGVRLTESESVVRARPTDVGLLTELATAEQTRPKFGSERRYVGDWLDPELPVPVGHVLEFAHVVGCSAHEAADRLMALGFRLPDSAVLPETVTADDLIMLSRDLDREPPWLDVADPVPLGHVLAAAERTKRRPAEVVARLAELGLRLVEGATLPETTGPDDVFVLSKHQAGQRPWLDVADPVPLGHVLAAAERTKRRPAEVVARLAELGLRLVEGAVLPEAMEPGDLAILRQGLTPDMPWWDVARPVPPAYVLVAAHAARRSPGEVAARLVQLGLRLDEDAVLPPTVETEDLALLNAATGRGTDWLRCTVPVPLGHVLAVAERFKRRPADVAARLGELGLRLPDGAGVPDVVESDDLFLLSKARDRDAPWLDAAVPVPLGHVLAVAERFKRRPAEVVARLGELGLHLAEGRVLPEVVGVDDPAMLRVEGDPMVPWLDETVPVPVSHVLAVASRLRRRPMEVAARLAGFGLRVADGSGDLAKIELEDLRMLMVKGRFREGNYEWLDKQAPVDLWHVHQGASLSGRSLAEVARRFRELGFTLARDVIYTGAE